MREKFELPNATEMEKQLLAAMFIPTGKTAVVACAILNADDLYRPEHQMIFRAIMRLYAKGEPIDYLSVKEELRKTNEPEKINRQYLHSLSIIDTNFSTDRAEYYAKVIKENADRRRLILTSQILREEANNANLSPNEIVAKVQSTFEQIGRNGATSQKHSFADFFANHFDDEVDRMKNYTERKFGFDNLDRLQIFNPGLYVIGGTPAAGKTTFCWQLLEQLAESGEECIYCSYEMSKFELFSKSLARELFKRNPKATLTVADIRRGGRSAELANIVKEFGGSSRNLNIFELQDENVDDLLTLLRPFCQDKAKAPIICLDYLQIVPTGRDSVKLGIDDFVRKLKKFQHDTNTTFLVISSFNRANYVQSVSFESFKESGNIEYTADVVWALQLHFLNTIKAGNNANDTRKKIDEAKRKQPRQIIFKCLKNRHGNNYECCFNYYSAHDCFVSCDTFKETKPVQTEKSVTNSKKDKAQDEFI